MVAGLSWLVASGGVFSPCGCSASSGPGRMVSRRRFQPAQKRTPVRRSRCAATSISRGENRACDARVIRLLGLDRRGLHTEAHHARFFRSVYDFIGPVGSTEKFLKIGQT